MRHQLAVLIFPSLAVASGMGTSGCRDSAREDRIMIVDAGRVTIVEPAYDDTSGPRTAGEVTVIGTAAASDARVDDTAQNVRDRGTTTLTAGEQSLGSSEDRAILQKVRQGVMRDTHLSALAKNVTIVCIDGIVTLRGPVKSEAERAAIEHAAKMVPGVKRVDNQLEIDAAR